MKKLNRQHVINEVYRHFITEGNPAGTSNGEACYHNKHEGQDYPCAIGLFDTGMLLANIETDVFPAGIEDLVVDRPSLIKQIFDVDGWTQVDVLFLDHVQHAHDRSACAAANFKQAVTDNLSLVAHTYRLVNPHMAAA